MTGSGAEQRWANPLAAGPLVDRSDVQRAVRDLYAPLIAHASPGGAQIHLGSFGAVFESRVAGLEGFARPLYGIVPLTVGGGRFDHWDRIRSGLVAGTDPTNPDFWGPVVADVDQRMVEQAAIGLALAFCPEEVWEPLGPTERRHLVDWLHGIDEFEPAPNNWQFFRVLVSLGLERVGAPVDTERLQTSLDRLDTYRRGDGWYVDGAMGTVDYYVPFALHTYGLMYAAANDAGLGDDRRAEEYRQRAAAFASDFVHWFAVDGASIAMGRSLTYRFAMSSFWGAMAWADVESPVGWGLAKGLSMRHLRWWADQAISDRDGVLSVGFAYDNRKLCEGYNSAGSPYWCMKAFGGLAAPADHPFWSADEAPLEPLDQPVTLADAGWVVTRNDEHAVALVAAAAPLGPFPEEAAAKYHKFAYSSAFGLSGDAPDTRGSAHTDSMLALTDADGTRRVRASNVAVGVEGSMAWSTWTPWPDVRVDSVCWAVDGAWHGRAHRVRSGRNLTSAESGFCVGYEPVGSAIDRGSIHRADASCTIATPFGASTIVDGAAPAAAAGAPVAADVSPAAAPAGAAPAAADVPPAPAAAAAPAGADVPPAPAVAAAPSPATASERAAAEGDGASGRADRTARTPAGRQQAVNAGLMHPHSAVPMLFGTHPAGEFDLVCLVHGSPLGHPPGPVPPVPAAALDLLDTVSARALPVTS